MTTSREREFCLGEKMVEREINWEWTDSAVEMIPFGLLTGFYGKKEIRITKLAEEGFSPEELEEFLYCGEL